MQRIRGFPALMRYINSRFIYLYWTAKLLKFPMTPYSRIVAECRGWERKGREQKSGGREKEKKRERGQRHPG